MSDTLSAVFKRGDWWFGYVGFTLNVLTHGRFKTIMLAMEFVDTLSKVFGVNLDIYRMTPADADRPFDLSAPSAPSVYDAAMLACFDAHYGEINRDNPYIVCYKADVTHDGIPELIVTNYMVSPEYTAILAEYGVENPHQQVDAAAIFTVYHLDANGTYSPLYELVASDHWIKRGSDPRFDLMVGRDKAMFYRDQEVTYGGYTVWEAEEFYLSPSGDLIVAWSQESGVNVGNLGVDENEVARHYATIAEERAKREPLAHVIGPWFSPNKDTLQHTCAQEFGLERTGWIIVKEMPADVPTVADDEAPVDHPPTDYQDTPVDVPSTDYEDIPDQNILRTSSLPSILCEGAWYTIEIGQLASETWFQFFTDGTMREYHSMILTGPDTPPAERPLDDYYLYYYFPFPPETPGGLEYAVVEGRGIFYYDSAYDQLILVDDFGYELYLTRGGAIYDPY